MLVIGFHDVQQLGRVTRHRRVDAASRRSRGLARRTCVARNRFRLRRGRGTGTWSRRHVAPMMCCCVGALTSDVSLPVRRSRLRISDWSAAMGAEEQRRAVERQRRAVACRVVHDLRARPRSPSRRSRRPAASSSPRWCPQRRTPVCRPATSIGLLSWAVPKVNCSAGPRGLKRRRVHREAPHVGGAIRRCDGEQHRTPRPVTRDRMKSTDSINTFCARSAAAGAGPDGGAVLTETTNQSKALAAAPSGRVGRGPADAIRQETRVAQPR